MSATLTARLRRVWLDLHLWVGAGLFVFLVPLGLSGSVLMMREPLDKALHAQRYAVSQGPAALPASAYLSAAAAAFGDSVKPAQLRMPDKAGAPVVVSGRGRPAQPGARPAMLNAWLDPATGKVLDSGPGMDGLVKLSHDLHGQMLVPQVGRKVVGWLGVAMFANCLTGLWLWWPRGRNPLKGLRWRRSPSTNMNLHHLVGFWILVPLAVLSLTGVYISFPDTARALFGHGAKAGTGPGGGGGGPRFTAPLGHTALTADEAVAKVMAKVMAGQPGARLASLSLPTKGKSAPAWRVELKGQGHPGAMLVDDQTGAVSPAPPQNQGGDPLARAVRQTHEGEVLGPIWWTLVFVAGLAPTVLGVTGIVMWLRRRARRKALHALQSAAA